MAQKRGGANVVSIGTRLLHYDNITRRTPEFPAMASFLPPSINRPFPAWLSSPAALRRAWRPSHPTNLQAIKRRSNITSNQSFYFWHSLYFKGLHIPDLPSDYLRLLPWPPSLHSSQSSLRLLRRPSCDARPAGALARPRVSHAVTPRPRPVNSRPWWQLTPRARD